MKFISFILMTFTSFSALADCPNSNQFMVQKGQSSDKDKIQLPSGWEPYVGVTGYGKISSKKSKLESVIIVGKFFPIGCQSNSKENSCLKVTETSEIYCNYTDSNKEKFELHSTSQPTTTTFVDKTKWLCVQATFSKTTCVCNVSSTSSCSFSSSN